VNFNKVLLEYYFGCTDPLSPDIPCQEYDRIFADLPNPHLEQIPFLIWYDAEEHLRHLT